MSLSSGVIDMANGVTVSVIGSDSINMAISWPSLMLEPMIVMNAMLPFCTDIDVTHGNFLSQGIMDYLEKFQKREDDAVTSHCQIKLPFVVELDFQENMVAFEGRSVVLCCLRLAAPDTVRSHFSGLS